MKTFLLILLCASSSVCFGQENLWDLDTITDYKQRFFKNGKLMTADIVSHTQSIEINGELVDHKYMLSYAQLKSFMDTSGFKPKNIKKQGLWKIKLNNRHLVTQNKRFKTYELLEFRDGLYMGKKYEFTKRGRLLKTTIPYPTIRDTVLNGLQIISYDKKGQIKEIEFTIFGLSTWDYSNTMKFHPNGALESWDLDYSQYDDSTFYGATEYYHETGECKGYQFNYSHINERRDYSVRLSDEGVEEDFSKDESGYRFTEYRLNGELTYSRMKKIKKKNLLY